MHSILKHIVPVGKEQIRLQEYGVGIFQRIASKSALKKAIKKNLVFVNGCVASTATIINAGEIITYHHPQQENKDNRLKLSLEVIFEDNFLAIINKPAGILVSGNTFKSITNALEQNLTRSTALDAVKPQPAHRLDYPTTGVVLIAKTGCTLVALNKLFEKKQIYKTYFAVTIGPMNSKGLIEVPVDDRVAVSAYVLLKTIPSERFGCLNLVQLHPRTGRRHQLRKHLFSIGNPILGDATYFLDGLLLKGKGMYLHAQSLQFTHPISQAQMEIHATLPKRFKKLFPEVLIELEHVKKKSPLANISAKGLNN